MSSYQGPCDEAKLFVHYLLGGRAVCGMSGRPIEWPDGHRWVGPDQHHLLDRVNCQGCINYLRENVEDYKQGVE